MPSLDSSRGFSFSRSSTTSSITALTTWEMTVASAAPATPIFRPTTSTRSITIFTRQATIREITGRWESPIARRRPASIL